MYPEKDGVRIVKGLMDYYTFTEAMEQHNLMYTTKPIVFHFRIATHGTICEENTHPFPITRNVKQLQSLDIHAEVGMAHNGIIDQMKKHKHLSDTMIFVRDYLTEFRSTIHAKHVQRMISLLDFNKFVFLSADRLSMVGAFFEENGWFYSNDTYLNEAFSFDTCEMCQQSVSELELTKYMNAWVCEDCILNIKGIDDDIPKGKS